MQIKHASNVMRESKRFSKSIPSESRLFLDKTARY